MENRKQSIEEILQCPITKSGLVEVSKEMLYTINCKIVLGEMCFLNGKEIQNPIDGAYQSTFMDIVYPVLDDVIYMLPKYAIIDKSIQDLWGMMDEFAVENEELENFYEEFGWKKRDDSTYMDAAVFEDLREVSNEYIHNCHMRVKKMLPLSGKYLLDAASGPIQFEEYMEYSKNYDYRVCLDISTSALQEAKNKLGNRGIYIIGDVANIPIKAEKIDAAISLNTIYHIPKEQQLIAFKELHRVLKSGAPGVVVYEWGRYSYLMNMFVFPYKVYQHIEKRFKKIIPINHKQPNIYFHAFDQTYFTADKLGFDIKTYVWRSVSVPFMKIYIHGGILGKWMLNMIYKIEEKYPSKAGKFGEYPMFVFNKSNELAA